MNRDEYNTVCGALQSTTHVIQWGDADVWKVGGKVFAIAGWSDGSVLGVTFKTSRTDYDFLVRMPGLRPAPYLASRGFSWVQNYKLPGLGDTELSEHLEDSHRIVAEGLTKKRRIELRLTEG
ncbi:MmcQ/YjbR family DNA-binding protein [Acidimicrobiaceae bacterium AH-315-P05]|nr:MmcQ/YjbR family DNA-binding protein [Acidimicrobiaceae bacterium AH-315-P05]